MTSATLFHAPRLAALSAVIALAAPASAAFADSPNVPPGFESVFTGALVSTYPDGQVAKMWVSPDGTFSGVGRHGGHNAGKWTVAGGRVCMRQSRPVPLFFRYCTPLPSSLANPWPAKAPTGEAVTLRFVAGDRPKT